MPHSGKPIPTILRRPLGVAAVLVALVALLTAACSGDAATQPLSATPTPVPAAIIDLPTLPTPAPDAGRAEFGPFPGEVGSPADDIQVQDPAYFVNSDVFSLEDLRGEVVLIDFWTYTCVNCIRTLPYLRDWQEKYGDIGLNIVGVHTPEFEFEKLRENVEEAIAEFDIGWSVVQDNDFLTWRAFNNRFWPAKYLIDKDGIIRYTHFGEGAYVETEEQIRDLLLDAGVNLAGIAPNTVEGPEFDERAFTGGLEGNQTRELYAGLNPQFFSQQPYILQSELYSNPADSPVEFTDPGDHINNFLYFHGMWTPTLENMRHSRETEDLEDYLVLRYNGTSVNVVLEVEDEPYRVYVTQDDAPVAEADWGVDMQQDEDGGTYIMVDKDRMYRVIESPEYSGHELKLASNSDQFTVFAFTFGSYPTGP